jgi:hypothetical protein
MIDQGFAELPKPGVMVFRESIEHASKIKDYQIRHLLNVLNAQSGSKINLSHAIVYISFSESCLLNLLLGLICKVTAELIKKHLDFAVDG